MDIEKKKWSGTDKHYVFWKLKKKSIWKQQILKISSLQHGSKSEKECDVDLGNKNLQLICHGKLHKMQIGLPA